MPNELKIIIDAEIQPAETKIKSFGKTVVGEFNKINSSANSLSSDITSSVNKINQSLSSLKVTSLDISINTSGIDAGIKSIQSKFAALTNPEVNVLANTELAEAKIKELLTELQTLKGSEIFIRANDTQALQKINEIEKELNSLVGKQINLSVAADLSKIQQLQEKINSLKVTPVNVVVNTSSLDAQIKNIQSKFSTLVDPKINVLADTTQAETVVKELLSELKALKGSEIFIKANDVQALKVIEGVEAELNTLLDKQIKLNINATDATAKLALLEKELADLQTLTIQPDISTTQLSVFEANIKRLKAEIAALKGQAIVVPITADTTSILKAKDDLDSLIGKTIKVDVDATVALAKINELKGKDVGTFVLKADNTQVIASIEQFKAKLESTSIPPIVVPPIKIPPIVIPPIPPIPPPPVGPVIKSINQLEAELADLSRKIDFSTDINEIRKLGDEFKRVQGQINNIKVVGAVNGFDRLGKSIDNTSNKLKAVPRSSGAATQSLINLGRVAQDAPFGIIGIANNINPLLESFQRLRAESTSTGAALKAFGAGLLGGGGIGLGVSVITGILTQFALSNRGVKEELASSVPVINQVKEREKEFQEAVDKASQSVVNQADKLKDLKAILISTSSEIGNITNATVKQGLAQLLFDKKNVQLQKALTAEIQREIFKRGSIFSTIPEFDPNLFSKNPFDKVVAQADQAIKMLNAQSGGLGEFFRNILTPPRDAGKELDKLMDETIARARQFVKEFGDVFVLPDLTETFFKGAKELLPTAKKLLDDVTKGNLQIKIPVITDFEFLPVEVFDAAKGAELAKNLTDQFIKGIQLERGIPVDIVLDPSLSLNNTKLIDEKLKLKKLFEDTFGNLGVKAFDKINFDNLTKGIADATKQFVNMKLVLDTIAQSVGQGLTSAFDNVFDAILQGQNVFKALGESVKALVVETIKAIAKMLILKFVTKLLGAGIGLPGLPGGISGGGFGLGGQISGRSFNNTLNVIVQGQISGQNILLSGQRAAGSNTR
jgi:hypothetical protein